MTNKNVNLAPEEITNKDLRKAWTRWHLANEVPHSFDRYIAASLLFALMPILRKLYKDEEELKAAYQRHLLFFNTQATWGGGTITGIVASLEEERAHEVHRGDEVTIDDDLIYNTKAGLMGALAGIGDSIDSGTVQYIFIAIALPWAQQGSPLGALFPFIGFALYQYFIGLYFTNMGYRMGRSAATEIVAGRKIQSIIEGLSILGLFMMGILAGNYVKVSSSLSWSISGREFVLQDILDSLIPGLLPLLTVFGVYYYFTKKGLNVTKALLGLTVILGVLAAVGIL
ncbi:MAG TPA: PTS system mannose/fructose/sorbose family transporter subunit IID [Erysipelothrix sp.]|nr:PTS system mannose/fructose/sorbose family transporter subunit IID [Erysipelothrix sp.]